MKIVVDPFSRLGRMDSIENKHGNEEMETFLQFGKAGEPMTTVKVENKYEPMQHHKLGLSYTTTGYGAKIPSELMVKYENRWRRVYVSCFGNSGTAYILIKGEKILVKEY